MSRAIIYVALHIIYVDRQLIYVNMQLSSFNMRNEYSVMHLLCWLATFYVDMHLCDIDFRD